MTRFLSEALQAQQPFFQQGLQRLEAANGHPSNDIRLSTSVLHQTQAKLRQLGLDPHDTSAEELYHVLNEKVKADDAKLTRNLQTRALTHISLAADVVAGMVHALRDTPGTQDCFGIKATRLRIMIKKVPPKKAMKQLGYRSIDSFLKHENLTLVLTAAWLTESPSWQKQLLDQYKKLKASDFETRRIAILQPDSQRWQSLAGSVVDRTKHNLLSFKELGAIVLLPLPRILPSGAVTASLTLALHELNEIRATSTFLKLCQVRPDFGNLVRSVILDEPKLDASVLDQVVPWHLVQRYYARLGEAFRDELFGPHIRAEDMSWKTAEAALNQIEPSLDFWQGNTHLALLHNHQAVSLNLVDAALNLCNNLPFQQRLTQAFQRSLWHELLLQYLKHDTVEQTVAEQLQPQLAAEVAIA